MQPDDQNSGQPNQPIQPVQNLSAGSLSASRTIQPLSSEDDIRKEVEATRPQTPTQPEPVSQTDTPINSSSVESADTYTGSLITEPIHRQPQVAQSQFQVSTSQPQLESRKIIPILAGLIVVGALAAGAYFFLFNSKIQVSDLVQATSQQTTYLRPRQWRAVGTDGTYGDLKGANNKSTAVVAIKESEVMTSYTGASDAVYEQVRTQLMSQISVSAIAPTFQNSGVPCKSDITFKKEPDSKKTKNATGLFLMSGTCTREDGEFTVKIRSVVGISDSRLRAVIVAARNIDWNNSGEAFQAVLDSVGQANI